MAVTCEKFLAFAIRMVTVVLSSNGITYTVWLVPTRFLVFGSRMTRDLSPGRLFQ